MEALSQINLKGNYICAIVQPIDGTPYPPFSITIDCKADCIVQCSNLRQDGYVGMAWAKLRELYIDHKNGKRIPKHTMVAWY